MKLLSRFEEQLLLAVARLGLNAYGVKIREELKELTGHSPAHGAIHTTMDRLEKRGYITSGMSEPGNTRGGRSKRIYKLRPSGMRALKEIQAVQQKMWSGVPGLETD